MTSNVIKIETPEIGGMTIRYRYEVAGPWSEAFDLSQAFEAEYDIDVSGVPTGVAMVPLLSNVLPIAWVYDALIEVPVCDADFLACLPEIKSGYKDMYPMMHFGGELRVNTIEKNRQSAKGAVCFFSGGVDAFNTLIQHIEERPALLTMRGADVKLCDISGWTRVRTHGEAVAQDFGVEFHEAASTFRTFLHEDVLTRKVAESGDGWWHGFQHGMGILGHAAPLAWVLGKNIVYIASSNTAETRAGVTCASDPTIDNYVRYCGVRVHHDGFEFSRQDKVRNIVQYSQSSQIPISLRVCWESEGGSNCCACEKCARTILEVMAEGGDACQFGFDFDDRQFDRLMHSLHYATLIYYPFYYSDAARASEANEIELPKSARWIFSNKLERIANNPVKHIVNLGYRAIRKLCSLAS